jgi:hypothetical protein
MIWEKTQTQFLLRDQLSGRYYCRFYKDGKQQWHSLKTEVYSVAQAKLSAKLKSVPGGEKAKKNLELGKGIGGLRHEDLQPLTRRAFASDDG